MEEGTEEGVTGEDDVGNVEEGLGRVQVDWEGEEGGGFVWGSVSVVSAAGDVMRRGADGKLRCDACGTWRTWGFASARF